MAGDLQVYGEDLNVAGFDLDYSVSTEILEVVRSYCFAPKKLNG